MVIKAFALSRIRVAVYDRTDMNSFLAFSNVKLDLVLVPAIV
jgi:hypothetical protein